MRRASLSALLGLLAVATALPARAYEINAWPAFVIEKDGSGDTVSSSGLGPLLVSEPIAGPDAGRASGLRPFLVRLSLGDTERTDVLYPLFFYRQYPDHYRWTILDLITGEGVDSDVTRAGGPTDKHFDVWPFYFSHETADPVDTYHALFPIYGTIKYRLSFDRVFWAPFPIFVQTEKKDTTSTYVPWPIIRFVSGAEHGFDLWPLYGSTEGPGPARHMFALWPLIWDNTLEPKPGALNDSAPPTEVGFLPLFTRETGPGYLD
ncbi:MAG TPA: hypothetical protein VGG37_02330, partial [Opitutaceae bacterium]